MKIDETKLGVVRNALRDAGVSGLTTNEAYIKTGFMRPTIDRYFEYLKETEQIIEFKKGSAKIRIEPKAALKDLKNFMR